MLIDLSTLSTNQIYYTFIQTIIPRPIAWVLSDNGSDARDPYNLAPFSYFNGVSSNPPIISLSIGRKPDGTRKDTWVNIAERREFVIHIAHREFAKEVTNSAASLGHGESELELFDLELVKVPGFRLPRWKEARIAFFCEVHQIIEVGNTPQGLILGGVKAVYVDDAVGSQDESGRLSVDPKKVDPLSRLGGQDFGLFGDVITVKRPK